MRVTIPGRIDLLDLHRRAPERYPFLLQSVAEHPQTGRYSLLFAFPAHAISGPAFFSRLSDAFIAERGQGQDGDLPFTGGWFLLLGYEAVRGIEPQLRLPDSPFRLPDALAVRCPAAVICDHHADATILYAESDPQQLGLMQQDVRSRVAETPVADRVLIDDLREDAPQRYLAGIARIQEYLRAGDIFQANLSRGWRAALAAGVGYLDVYRQLRRHNPAPFAGFASWQGTQVLSSSPERLIEVDGGFAQTRPIAGTRPRSADPAQDRLLREALIGNLKERAEHVMLIDLERNDLGRVCEPGSVEVSELMTVESYAHVHHIVSNVRGRLRDDAGPVDALRAVFPGGTITGCPKLRAIEILAELEGRGRGPYTGAMGYLSRCGRLDSNILIRSLVCEDGQVSFRAGGGIVADSIADAELAESRAKARGLLLALGVQP